MSKEYSYLSVDQFLQGYQALTDGDISRLVGVCYSLRNVYRLQLEPKDLMQDALTRIIGGDRRVPVEVPLVVVIANMSCWKSKRLPLLASKLKLSFYSLKMTLMS